MRPRLPPPAPPRPGASQPPESESQVIVVYGDTCAAATHSRPSPAITLLFGRVIAGVLAKNGSSSGHEPLVPLFSCRSHNEAPCYCGVRRGVPFPKGSARSIPPPPPLRPSRPSQQTSDSLALFSCRLQVGRQSPPAHRLRPRQTTCDGGAAADRGPRCPFRAEALLRLRSLAWNYTPHTSAAFHITHYLWR